MNPGGRFGPPDPSEPCRIFHDQHRCSPFGLPVPTRLRIKSERILRILCDDHLCVNDSAARRLRPAYEGMLLEISRSANPRWSKTSSSQCVGGGAIQPQRAAGTPQAVDPGIGSVLQQLRRQQCLDVKGLQGSDCSFSLTRAGRTLAAERAAIAGYTGMLKECVAGGESFRALRQNGQARHCPLGSRID